MSNMKLVTFEPLDSLFFREARPFNAGEGGFLDSQFPPPAQTLSGAIRGAIGDAANLDWCKKDKAQQLKLIGAPGDDPAPLSFAGPYLFKDRQRLYPVPLNLLYSEERDETTKEIKREWMRLVPSGSMFKTDMGNRELPTPEKFIEGAKPIEEGWLTVANMQRVLQGELPIVSIHNKDAGFIPADKVFVREARAGIGRDNQRSVANNGQLYFTRHLRLHDGITLGMAAGGAELPDGCMVRLGGEGRLARIVVGEMPKPLAVPKIEGTPRGLILTLLTLGDFCGEAEPDWRNDHPDLELVSACVGKAVREGGWDYAKRQPKPLKSLVPAGSCYFVQVKSGNLMDMAAKLHGKPIGQRTAFGYGEIAVGLWK